MEFMIAATVGFVAFTMLAGIIATLYFLLKLRDSFSQWAVDMEHDLKAIQADTKVSRKTLVPKVPVGAGWNQLEVTHSGDTTITKRKGRVIRRSEEQEAELEKPLNERKV